jgi:hypothetical protein
MFNKPQIANRHQDRFAFTILQLRLLQGFVDDVESSVHIDIRNIGIIFKQCSGVGLKPLRVERYARHAATVESAGGKSMTLNWNSVGTLNICGMCDAAHEWKDINPQGIQNVLYRTIHQLILTRAKALPAERIMGRLSSDCNS